MFVLPLAPSDFYEIPSGWSSYNWRPVNHQYQTYITIRYKARNLSIFFKNYEHFINGL
jgi:hypothetical protein